MFANSDFDDLEGDRSAITFCYKSIVVGLMMMSLMMSQELSCGCFIDDLRRNETALVGWRLTLKIHLDVDCNSCLVS